MSIKSLIFILFLYVLLVWVAAFGWHSSGDIQPFGLLWTAVGIATILAAVILSWLYTAWRAHRAKARQKPPAPEKPRPLVHPEDAAIEALIATANAALIKLPHPGGAFVRDIRQLPLYLLVGPEGSGKTGVFVNCGIEPHLLAGNASDDRRPVRTELLNLWFSGGAIFAEISGQAFTATTDTWARLLSALRGGDRRPVWKRILKDKSAHAMLAGVIGFCHARELIGAAADPQKFERSCRWWRERLKSIGEKFGESYPLYQIFTNYDSVPFFTEFFRRLPEGETGQVFGCAVGPVSAVSGESSDERAKRLIGSFRDLYRNIVERRFLHLAGETDLKTRPSIYEFPRELKKLRTPLIQFLTDIGEIRSLQPGARLRGFYMTGMHEVSAMASPPVGMGDPSTTSFEASRVLRGDGTSLFRSDDLTLAPKPRLMVGRQRWLFAADVFRKALTADRIKVPAAAPVRDAAVERLRLSLMTAAACVCVLVCTGFTMSWSGNRALLHDIEGAALNAPPSGLTDPTLSALRALEALRVRLEELRRGPGVSLHMGLYTGDHVVNELRAAYFLRVQHLLLNGINSRLVEALQASDGADTNSIYRILKTHLMITSGSCEPEPQLVASVLNQFDRTPADEASPAIWQSLANRQIEFYVSELKLGNPCRLTENTMACSRAREVLQKRRGVSAFYAELIAKADKGVDRTYSLSELAPGYEQVLSGPQAISAAFTPEGREIVASGAKDFHVSPVDACVLGSGGSSKAQISEIQSIYTRDYIDHWRKYLAGFEVNRYKNAQDAAAKLARLADHKSPLLALFALAANATDYKPSLASNAIDKGSQVIDKVFGKAVGDKAAESARLSSDEQKRQIAATFQPAQWVVAPGSDTWVSDHNAAYLETLAQLGHSMQDLAENKNPGDPALFQSASQNYDKALDAARQIAKGFRSTGSAGVDGTVQRLLLEPVERTKAFIVDPAGSLKTKIDTQFQSLCRTIGPTLRKYPFQNVAADATLAEFGSVFAPATGAIWQFQAEALGELLVNQGGTWKVKDPGQKLLPTQRLLTFINRAQAITSAFYPKDATAPRLTYVLRPKPDATTGGNLVIELEVDGQEHQWNNSYQSPFTWPAAPGVKPGAVARAGIGNFAAGFASWDGVWGIFRVIADAEPRALQSPIIEWKYTRGRDGKMIEIKPAPVRLEIVEFPGGADVFNARFYDGLQCAGAAIQ